MEFEFGNRRPLQSLGAPLTCRAVVNEGSAATAGNEGKCLPLKSLQGTGINAVTPKCENLDLDLIGKSHLQSIMKEEF